MIGIDEILKKRKEKAWFAAGISSSNAEHRFLGTNQDGKSHGQMEAGGCG